MDDIFGTTDCERIGDGFLSQPVNALSSLAFLPAGWWVLRHRPERAELAAATAAVGVGSFLAHGPRWPRSTWLHDVTIAWSLAAVELEGRPRLLRLVTYAGLGALFALRPGWNDGSCLLLAGLVIARESRPGRRSFASRAALRLAAAGALIGNLCRTGSRLCQPDSRLQGHAAWHALAASALAAWGAGAPPARR